jgi:hypothetical protein
MTPRRRNVSPADEVASELPYAYLECRDMGHQWRHQTVRRDGNVYIEVVDCIRCGTERDRFISLDGWLSTGGRNAYRYPQGYLVKSEDANLIDKEGRAAIRRARMSGW